MNQCKKKKMKSLLDTCVHYIKSNLNKILLVSSTEMFHRLDDALLIKLGEELNNTDVEKLINHHASVKTNDNGIMVVKTNNRLEFFYHNLICSLALPNPERHKGHYWSAHDLYKCSNCKKLISIKISDKIQCFDSYITMNRKGEIVHLHEVDTDWNLMNHIDAIRKELDYDFRKVYWRIWSECHYLFCTHCNLYYSLYDSDKCFYHSDVPIFNSFEKHNNQLDLPTGNYKCCGMKAYVYNCARISYGGCQKKHHKPMLLKNDEAVKMMNIFKSIKHLLFSDNKQDDGRKTQSNKNIKRNAYTINNNIDSSKYADLQNQLRLYPMMHKNWQKKGLIGRLSDKIIKLQSEKFKRIQSTELVSDFHSRNYVGGGNDLANLCDNNDNLIDGLADKMSQMHTSNRKKRHKSFKSTVAVEKLKNLPNNFENNDSVEHMETPSSLLHTKKCQKILSIGSHQVNSNNRKVDEMQLCIEGCCLPLQEINSDERYFNKPIQYTKRSHRHKKMNCGLQSNRWYNNFSTRYNQDKQRESDRKVFAYINTWLTDSMNTIDALTDEKIVSDYLTSSRSETDFDNYEDDEITRINSDDNYREGAGAGKGKRNSLSSCSSVESLNSLSANSISSYCSTLNSAIRVYHSRTTNVWNSFTPLAGTFVRIETEWKDAMHDYLRQSAIRISKNNNHDPDNNNNNFDNGKYNSILQPQIFSRLKSRCKYPYYKNVHVNNRQRSFKYKGENMHSTAKRKPLELPLMNSTVKDLDNIWCYNRYSHELDYLSPTYMPVPNCKYIYRNMNRNFQSEWDDMMNLEKSWNAFLKLFFENEPLPDIHSENKIQKAVQCYRNLYNLYSKIDGDVDHSKSSNEINSDFEETEFSEDDCNGGLSNQNYNYNNEELKKNREIY